MKDNQTKGNQPQPALFIGIDWADQKHDAYTIDRRGRGALQQIEHTPESIDVWVTEKLKQANGQPIAILLEQSRGPLVHALMFRENVILYPINPKQFARYRESFSNAGCKDDTTDAKLLARMLHERIQTLRAWEPDDERTRSLARLCETRRKLVNERTRLAQQLIAQLKAYFPLAMKLTSSLSISPLTLALLKRWPDPRKLKRADRRVLDRVLKEHSSLSEEKRREVIDRIRSAPLLSSDRALIESAAIMAKCLAKQICGLQKAIDELALKIEAEMKDHPDAALFTALPGAGKALAPRLLVAFGSQRDRYANADEVATFSGIAPVTKQSGKSRTVHRRYACPKYLRQTFHEFADHARKWCPWSRAYYKCQRGRGMKHQAAIRKLASRWIRILFRVWKDRTAYDPASYLATIQRKNPAITPFLETTTK